jgi:hypothetical protein
MVNGRCGALSLSEIVDCLGCYGTNIRIYPYPYFVGVTFISWALTLTNEDDFQSWSI